MPPPQESRNSRSIPRYPRLGIACRGIPGREGVKKSLRSADGVAWGVVSGLGHRPGCGHGLLHDGLPCAMMRKHSAAMVTKEIFFLNLSTLLKNRATVRLSTHRSGPSCHDGPVWPCTGALCPCICRQPPEIITACRRDDLGVANANVTVTDYAFPQHSCAPRGRLR